MLKKIIFSVVALSMFNFSVFATQLGFEFFSNSTPWLNANILVNEAIELKPGIQLHFGDNINTIGIGFDFNYYLSPIKPFNHYIGAGISFVSIEYENPLINDETSISFNGHYGLRYTLNEHMSIFGELGVNLKFSPTVFSTQRPGLGVTFYLPQA